jgi:hypothetical protein
LAHWRLPEKLCARIASRWRVAVARDTAAARRSDGFFPDFRFHGLQFFVSPANFQASGLRYFNLTKEQRRYE